MKYEKDVTNEKETNNLKRKRDGNLQSNRKIMKQIKVLQKQLKNIESLVKNDIDDVEQNDDNIVNNKQVVDEEVNQQQKAEDIVFYLLQKGIDYPVEYHCPIGGTPFANVTDNDGNQIIVKARDGCGVGSLYKRVGVEYGKMSLKTRITSRTVFKIAKRDDYDSYEKKSREINK